MKRVEIIAKTEAGRLALRIHMEEEAKEVRKAKRIPKFMRNKELNKFLKVEREYVFHDDGHPRRNTISGYDSDYFENKDAFRQIVDGAMKENGAKPEDFEVKFYDK